MSREPRLPCGADSGPARAHKPHTSLAATIVLGSGGQGWGEMKENRGPQENRDWGEGRWDTVASS